MASKILSAALIGIEAALVEIEASLGGGDFGQIAIVGLPDTSVGEAKERVRSAIINSGWEFPKRKITVNLAPAELKKMGPSYDLPIALSIIALKYKLKHDLASSLFVGELSLSGDVRPIRGAVAIASETKRLGLKKLFLPTENFAEAALVEGLEIFPISNLRDLVEHLAGKNQLKTPSSKDKNCVNTQENAEKIINLNEIKGQAQAKRALAIAVAGGHNLLFHGPPGCGKTSLAQAAAGLLPPLSAEEKLELRKIYSLVSSGNDTYQLKRPFRAPHHQASAAALTGGGQRFQPGEVTLAHLGILFLDELPEFSRPALESLRQPLESGRIVINRAGFNLILPARFILIAAMNPCPCGFKGARGHDCCCSPEKINNYRRKISGPLLDRIDLQVEVENISYSELTDETTLINSSLINQAIIKAREHQKRRLASLKYPLNSYLSSQAIKSFCPLEKDGQKLLQTATNRLNLSNRSYFKILKIARTIADLEEQEQIQACHVAEALHYRLRS